eukprot:tig00021348_g20563.t1
MMGDVEKGFLGSYLLGVLRALRPPDGTASALDPESLSVGLTCEYSSSDADRSDLALSGLPHLERLRLTIYIDTPAALDGVVALLRSAGARRALYSLKLSFDDRPLSEAEAEAVVALPALERLVVCCSLEGPGPGPASARPYEILRGLPPQVLVRVELKNGGMLEPAFAEASGAIKNMFWDRWPIHDQ